MIKVILKKLSDDRFEGKHPNDVFEGHVEIGYMIKEPKVGDRFGLFIDKKTPVFITSIVTSILDNCTFQTINSTYKYTQIDE